ncbi:DUF4328 domain-containing protein [Streptomyces sp. NBC_00094]|uniref:DUF4328 domain-containing protein n=1 Tax=Streptomyces sp. NBC_00094 TaxID=2903620 RepID=UPI002251E186|nr:DUF4328 domain-containing protein [Streptomyces sp. NBC_00094]MCX5392732.1 DUF4328 domain-containing protein [Streptomyces sp. NBC_00094]
MQLRNPNGLSYAVIVLLALNIVFDLVLAASEIRALSGPDEALWATTFVGINLNLAYSVAFTLYVATGIVFIVWFHRLRKNAEVWAGDLQSRKPGWAIGGWFIPIANLWIPRGVAVDIWRASRWQPHAAVGRGELVLLNSWWTVWVACMVVDRIASQLYKQAVTADALTTAATWSLAGYLLDAAAAVLAILFVRRLTSMQQAKATGMIPAAVTKTHPSAQ